MIEMNLVTPKATATAVAFVQQIEPSSGSYLDAITFIIIIIIIISITTFTIACFTATLSKNAPSINIRFCYAHCRIFVC